MAWTQSGVTCQAWELQYPRKHSNTPDKFPKAGLVKNYCRNPDGEPGGPWCYTTSGKDQWEYCDVKFCGNPGKYLYRRTCSSRFSTYVFGEE